VDKPHLLFHGAQWSVNCELGTLPSGGVENAEFSPGNSLLSGEVQFYVILLPLPNRNRQEAKLSGLTWWRNESACCQTNFGLLVFSKGSGNIYCYYKGLSALSRTDGDVGRPGAYGSPLPSLKLLATSMLSSFYLLAKDHQGLISHPFDGSKLSLPYHSE
jgi:hypothetical protein